jgi:hypothetical protein
MAKVDDWKLIACPLCGAEPASNCFDLFKAVGGGIGTHKSGDGKITRAEAMRATQANPHQARIQKAEAMPA